MRMKTTTAAGRLAPAGAVALIASALAGCGIANTNSDIAKTPVSSTTAVVTGIVHGGQQPVSGATIQLYAVGNTGTSSASTPLISQTVLTKSDGSFTITGLWDCLNTAAYGTDPLLYLVATGGNPGLGVGGNNPALAMMTALGRCSTVSAASFIFVDEVTTVASVYTLAPFMQDYAHIGTASANIAALANAFGSVPTLVNTATGVSPGSAAAAGTTVPVAEINTLANAMAACINSSGTGACTALFAATTPAGGSAPTETIGATLQIARSPLRNVASIYNMSGATVPFQPTLSGAPNDWSIMVKFTGGGLAVPAGIALDANGNAWVANAGGGSVTGLSSQGSFLTGANGYSSGSTLFGAQAVAVDKLGNVWLADTLLSSVVKLTVNNGVVLSSASFTTAVNGPTGLAIDSQNNVWVANFGDGSVTELNNSGVPLGGSPLTAFGTLQSPSSVAIDAAGNVWVTDNSASVVAKFDHNQNLLSGAGYSDDALLAPVRIAIDAQGRAWVAGNGNNGASLFNANGAGAASTPFLGGGLSMPTSVAIDGAGAAWLSNGVASGGLTQIPTAAGTATGGFGSLNAPADVAIDASGNIWTANSGDDSVSKFIGLGTPAVTPIVVAVGP